MNRTWRAFIMLSFLLLHAQAVAQDCNSKIIDTTPTQRFYDNQDGSVTDQATGLTWSRCSLGQLWEKTRCQGEARALPYAIVSLVNEPGWRLPKIAELSSLVELRCARPSINQHVFPGTLSSGYWTATRFINKDGHFWQVHFLHGETVTERVDGVGYVRWVRD